MEPATTSNTPTATGVRRPVVLVLIDYFLPGYKSGGPLRAISGLTETLGAEFDFMIITSDRDLGDKKPYQGIRRNHWMRVGKANVLYVNRWNPFAVIRQILKTPHDVLYMKSVFSRPFSIWPCWLHTLGILRTRRIVVGPCGEFAPGALALKGLRKRFYIAIARSLQVYKSAIWHVTSEYEGDDVRRELGGVVKTVTARSIASRSEVPQVQAGPRIVVASELSFVRTYDPPPAVVRTKVVGELRAVFLARVARNKNLQGVLDSLYGLEGSVSLDIYGPLEDKRYWGECQRIIENLPGNIQVHYWGSVPHEEVSRILANYHLFFFPTMGENFGYAIVEALLAGCPLLISDKTPWRGLESAGVGWDLPLDQPERFRQVLQRCVDMGPEEYGVLSAQALAYGWRHSQNPEFVTQNRKLFTTSLA